MNHHPVAEAERLAGAHGQSRVPSGVALKIVYAEDISGEQAIRLRVPVSGIPWIRWMVVDSHANRYAADLARVIHPLGTLTPHAFLATFPLGVHHLTGAPGFGNVLGLLLLQRRGQPDGKYALLGIAELHLLGR